MKKGIEFRNKMGEILNKKAKEAKENINKNLKEKNTREKTEHEKWIEKQMSFLDFMKKGPDLSKEDKETKKLRKQLQSFDKKENKKYMKMQQKYLKSLDD